MSLFSLYFYVFFSIVIAVIALAAKFFPGKQSVQTVLLAAASLVFIGFASWSCAVAIMAISFVTWLCGKWKSKILQYIGVLFLVGILIFYKCADAHNLSIIVPLGVSFFTFNAVSYLVDISRGELKNADFLHVLLYLSFFPRLASGPLQKAADFFHQIDSKKNITRENLFAGIQMYCFGLFKKLVLADRLSVFVDEVYTTPNAFSGFSILLAVVSYSLQIYFDFSGYSDMAIGTGKMLGFDLPMNFNMPYVSQNVTEFWRRWHISLSAWIRNYIYIPLGGNRKGNVRQNINLLIAMTLCGLWHGATLTFMLWGFIHGIALLVHKQFLKRNKNKPTSLVLKIVFTIATFVFVSLAWILFRSETLSQAFLVYKRLFTFAEGLNQPYFWSFVSIGITITVSVYVAVCKKREAFYPILNLSKYPQLTAFFVFLGLLFSLCATNGSPFIYGAF